MNYFKLPAQKFERIPNSGRRDQTRTLRETVRRETRSELIFDIRHHQGFIMTFSNNFFEQAAIALRNSSYSDVKIIITDDTMRPEYRLHKVILAAQSSFLRKLFYHEPKDVYEIGAISKGCFETVLRYMYGGRLILTEQNYGETEDAIIYLGCEKIMANWWMIVSGPLVED